MVDPLVRQTLIYIQKNRNLSNNLCLIRILHHLFTPTETHFLSRNMLPYDGVIRKRLRIKRQPPIPDFVDVADAAPTTSASVQPVGVGTSDIHDDVDEIQPAHPVERSTERVVDADDEVPSEDGDKPDEADETEEGHSEVADKRTLAERRFDETAAAREEDRLHREATKSYREKVDVSFYDFFSFCSFLYVGGWLWGGLHT